MHSGAATDNPNTIYLASQSPASESSFSQYGSGSVYGSADLRASGGSHCGGGGGSGVPNLNSGVDVPSKGPTTPCSDKANRIAQYEAMGVSPSTGGGYDAGFIVTRTNWAGKSPKDSPVARFPNGETPAYSVLDGD
jgi:hypothetical protein